MTKYFFLSNIFTSFDPAINLNEYFYSQKRQKYQSYTITNKLSPHLILKANSCKTKNRASDYLGKLLIKSINYSVG